MSIAYDKEYLDKDEFDFYDEGCGWRVRNHSKKEVSKFLEEYYDSYEEER